MPPARLLQGHIATARPAHQALLDLPLLHVAWYAAAAHRFEPCFLVLLPIDQNPDSHQRNPLATCVLRLCAPELGRLPITVRSSLKSLAPRIYASDRIDPICMRHAAAACAPSQYSAYALHRTLLPDRFDLAECLAKRMLAEITSIFNHVCISRSTSRDLRPRSDTTCYRRRRIIDLPRVRTIAAQ